MTTSYCINNTNKHQHKLRNSKNNSERFARYLPKIPSTLETVETVKHLIEQGPFYRPPHPYARTPITISYTRTPKKLFTFPSQYGII